MTRPARWYKYYDLIMAAFVCVLLCANLIGVSGKVATVGGFTFGAGNLFFPISYLFGDVLTEVYGYARSRKVVWAGFGALAFASLMAAWWSHLPPARGVERPGRAGGRLRLHLAHRARVAGRVRVRRVRELLHAGQAEGAHRRPRLWLRTIGSTIVGEAVDTVVFYPLAFPGVWATAALGAR